MLGMFLAALDQTIVATAIRTIGDDLNGLSLQAWVTTAYLVTATISTPLYGKLSDIYGRKPFFIFAISLFIFGSVLCTVSSSMYMLAGFRAIQGLGAGGLFTLALAIIGDIVPPRERAKYQAYFLAVFGTSSVLGPVVGGFLADQENLLGIAGWRWVFLVNVPIGLMALWEVSRHLHVPHTKVDHRVDWMGAVALTAAVIPVLLVAEQGRQWGWLSGASIACYAVALSGAGALLWAERHAGEEALLPLSLFTKNRTFAIGAATSLITGFGMLGGLIALPLYLQIVRGMTPTQAGLATLPLTVGIAVGAMGAGRLISKTGRYRVFPLIGAAAMIGGLVWMTTLGPTTSFWIVAGCMVVFGFGQGNVMQPLTTAMQNAVGREQMGVATSTTTFTRQMGGTLGVAVLLSIIFSQAAEKIGAGYRAAFASNAFQSAVRDPANAASVQALQSIQQGGQGLNDTSFLHGLNDVLAAPFKVGFSEAMHAAFWVAAAVLVFGWVLLLFMPDIPLRTRDEHFAVSE